MGRGEAVNLGDRIDEALNQAPAKALGSSKALRCEYVWPDGSRCGNQECTEFYFQGQIRFLLCESHWKLFSNLAKARQGFDHLSRVAGMSETGRDIWERNYWMARGRAEGMSIDVRDEGTGELYGWHDG